MSQSKVLCGCAGAIGALCLSTWLYASPPASGAPVADAAMQRNSTTVRGLLRQGADVNTAQGDGMTALHWAAVHDDAELVGILLYAGANVRATTRLGGYTPLHLAAKEGKAAVLDPLIESGAGVDALTSTGATALMLASASGNVEAVKRLLDHGASVNAKDRANEETPLMFAAASDRAEAVRLLLERGADARMTARVFDAGAITAAPGDEALQAASGRRNQPEAARTTRSAADVPGVTRSYRYNELIGKQGGLTSLHFGARQGSTSTVHVLVEKGVDVNQVSPADKTSPLLIATLNGHFDTAKYLLDHGADPQLASDAGATPLYAALNVQWAPRSFYPQPRAHLQQQTSYLELMKALLDKGADPNARLSRKLWYMQYNFDLLRIDETGATPFWRAAYASDVEAMKLLVAHGADPTIPTIKPFGRTRRGDDGQQEDREPTPDVSGLPLLPAGGPGIPPLLAAAGVGYGEGFAGNAHRFAPGGMLAAVTYLVEELHADVNTVDHEGSTALHHAAARGDNEMIAYLVSKGADVKTVNRRGQTTVDMANGPVQRIQPFPETIKLLESMGAKNNNKCVSC